MDTDAIDFTALALAVVIALGVTALLWAAQRDGNSRRGWMATAGAIAVLLTLGFADLLMATPRETHIASVLLGATLPVLGAQGLIRGMSRVRPVVRWLIVFLAALVLLLGGALLGATMVPKFLHA